MKKTTALTLFLFAATMCYSQPKETRDSTTKPDTIYVLAANEMNYIKSVIEMQRSGLADVKAEVWKYIIDLINTRKRPVAPRLK